MKKTLLSLLFLTLLLSASDNTVTFELKGEFGKELKALIEKYKDSGEITVIERKTVSDDKSIGQQIDSFFAEKEQKEQAAMTKDLLSAGERIFKKKCSKCHGKKGEEKAYNSSRPLNTLSLEDMKYSIDRYNLDDYDRGAAFIMKPYAMSVSHRELKGVYEYIQKINGKKK